MVSKRKRTAPNDTSEVCSSSQGETVELEVLDPLEVHVAEEVISTDMESRRKFCFKDSKFGVKKNGSPAKRPKTWRTLKQIFAVDKAVASNTEESAVTYESIDAPPSFKPAKKYSDISGLPAAYTDPHTKLRYASVEEFSRLRLLPMDIISGLLQLRRANNPTT